MLGNLYSITIIISFFNEKLFLGKLLSSDSEPSISHKILRSESSEDEDEMESCHESDDNDNTLKGKNKLEENEMIKGLEAKCKILQTVNNNNDKSEQKVAEEGDDELQTISVEVLFVFKYIFC